MLEFSTAVRPTVRSYHRFIKKWPIKHCSCDVLTGTQPTGWKHRWQNAVQLEQLHRPGTRERSQPRVWGLFERTAGTRSPRQIQQSEMHRKTAMFAIIKLHDARYQTWSIHNFTGVSVFFKTEVTNGSVVHHYHHSANVCINNSHQN